MHQNKRPHKYQREETEKPLINTVTYPQYHESRKNERRTKKKERKKGERERTTAGVELGGAIAAEEAVIEVNADLRDLEVPCDHQRAIDIVRRVIVCLLDHQIIIRSKE